MTERWWVAPILPETVGDPVAHNVDASAWTQDERASARCGKTIPYQGWSTGTVSMARRCRRCVRAKPEPPAKPGDLQSMKGCV